MRGLLGAPLLMVVVVVMVCEDRLVIEFVDGYPVRVLQRDAFGPLLLGFGVGCEMVLFLLVVVACSKQGMRPGFCFSANLTTFILIDHFIIIHPTNQQSQWFVSIGYSVM